MIATIQGNGSLNRLYPQYNSKRIKPIKALQGDERTSEDWSQITKKADNLEDTVTAHYQSKLAESTKDKDYISYESDNPYEKARQSIDNSLLVGIKLDVMA